VEEIRELLHLSVGDLATRLGLAYSTVLGRAQERPLSPDLREKLLALKLVPRLNQIQGAPPAHDSAERQASGLP
jgi:hypothetical protein